MTAYEKITCFTLCIVLIILLAAMSVLTAELDSARGLSNGYRERIVQSESVNRELGNKLAECREITARINETNSRNIRTARDAIEVIEQLRVQVQELNDCVESVNWDEYYQYWDDNFDTDSVN